MSTSQYLALECFKAGLFIVGLLGAAAGGFSVYGGLAALIPIATVMEVVGKDQIHYDTTYERLERIRNQVNEALKDRDISDERRQHLLRDLDAIDNIMEHVNNRLTLLDYIWRNMIPGKRKKIKQKDLQQDLEKLANNAMFEKAARFQNFATQ